VTASGAVPCAITGMGLRCAVGQDSARSCAAVRAGVSRFAEWPYMEAGLGEEGGGVVVAAVVPDPGDRSWVEKLKDLATQPLLEALWGAGVDSLVLPGQDGRFGIYLSVPPLDRPGVPEEDAEDFLEDLREGSLFPVEPGSTTVLTNGHAGVLLALDQAMRDLAQDQVDVCAVGGVDSLLESGYLQFLLEERKLKAGNFPVGLLPGEAAGFVVVETLEHARKRGAEVLARVSPVHTAMEAAPSHGDDPGRADGTTRVLREALADAPCGPGGVWRIVNDLNGERWRFLEWAMADARALSKLPPEWRLWHPADSFGDIGAATGAAHLCIAARAFQRGYARGEAILVCNSSEGGERAAAAVFRAEPDR